MFTLDARQQEKLREFIGKLPEAETGAIGGRLTYSFTPNGLGTVVVVEDSITKQRIDLTDYGFW